MTFQDETAPLKALYDDLLCHEKEYMARLKDDAQKAGQGIRTGIVLQTRDANDRISDYELVLPRYAITVIGARTGGGKTTTMVDLATRLARSGSLGMYVTLEEPAFSINAKMMSNYSKRVQPNYSAMWLDYFSSLKVINGTATAECADGFLKDIARRCRVIDANAQVKSEDIEKPTVLYYPQYISDLIKYRNHKADKPIDFVMIDFGQLLESGEGYDDSYRRIRTVMQALKNLSGSLGISVIVGAQMKRECMGVDIWDWEPEHLRDGSDMEQAANLILFVGKDKDTGQMVLRYGKNRNGPQNVGGIGNIDFAHTFLADRWEAPDES